LHAAKQGQQRQHLPSCSSHQTAITDITHIVFCYAGLKILLTAVIDDY
jgi:hypothetical protein